MSWQTYVKDLMEDGEMIATGIYSVDGNEWARGGTIQVSCDEVKRLVDLSKNKNADNSGVTAGGMNFLFVNLIENDHLVVLSRKNAPSENEKYILCATSTDRCLLIGFVVGRHLMGKCNTVLTRLRNYFKEMGY